MIMFYIRYVLYHFYPRKQAALLISYLVKWVIRKRIRYDHIGCCRCLISMVGARIDIQPDYMVFTGFLKRISKTCCLAVHSVYFVPSVIVDLCLKATDRSKFTTSKFRCTRFQSGEHEHLPCPGFILFFIETAESTAMIEIPV